jgi:hypothetical protein
MAVALPLQDSDFAHGVLRNKKKGSVKKLLFGLFALFIILHTNIAFTEEKKTYTDEDLKNYKSEEKSFGAEENMCDFSYRQYKECNKNDSGCQIFWLKQTRVLRCYESPVNVRIVE